MGIKKTRLVSLAHHNLNTGPTKALFVLIKPRAIVEITQNDQVIALRQMVINPTAQPETLRQLLAPVLNRDPHLFMDIAGTVRGL